MNVTMGDALWRCAIVMVDGICVASETMDDQKAHLGEVFSRLASRGHALKPKKVKLLQEEVEYLGHISTPRGIKITPGQREAIIYMPYPPDSEGDVEGARLRSFIGLANFRAAIPLYRQLRDARVQARRVAKKGKCRDLDLSTRNLL